MTSSYKETAIEAIKRIPDNASLEDIMYELCFRARIDRGLEQLAAGQTVSHEDVRRSLGEWLQSIGR